MGIGNARHWITGFALPLAATAMGGVARAQMTENTVNVGGRAASFLQPRMSGSVTAAIIYQPGNDMSEREARVIERELAAGLVIGALRILPRRVPANQLDELTGARIAFVTKGTNYRQVASATAPRAMLTITSDPVCVQSGLCTVAVQSSPRIQITVSKAACRSARIRFNSAFLMLVKEI